MISSLTEDGTAYRGGPFVGLDLPDSAMNYRHAFHAGNFADVMKHLALMLVLQHLVRKDKPFRVVDTHAGVGLYDLTSDPAKRTGEADGGITLLRSRVAGRANAPISVDGQLTDFFELIDRALRRVAHSDDKTRYPGSPLLARALIRSVDRLHANELHPEDAAQLKALFGRDRAVVLTERTGWDIVKAVLPPKERRGLVLIDPPFEEPGEFDRIVEALVQGRRRFDHGIYLAWYPIKDHAAVARFYDAVVGAGLTDTHACELQVGKEGLERGLTATGLIVRNPPFQFLENYGAVLAQLSIDLAQDADASSQIYTLAD
ncbi:MAG: 23S rRNA (adenine(2030)-N(6))-methyltransferase RlmJ [Pseudomonadota bacterium]